MTRLKRELVASKIVFCCEDFENYGSYENFIAIENGMLVTITGSNVMDSYFRIYDARTLTLIGEELAVEYGTSFKHKGNPHDVSLVWKDGTLWWAGLECCEGVIK